MHTMQKKFGDRPGCYSTYMHTVRLASRRLFKLAALAALACLKLCAIYDIRTNDLMAHLAWERKVPRSLGWLLGLVD